MKMVFSHVFRFLLENISINLRSRFYIIVNYRLNLIYLLAEKERYSWKLFRNIYYTKLILFEGLKRNEYRGS